MGNYVFSAQFYKCSWELFYLFVCIKNLVMAQNYLNLIIFLQAFTEPSMLFSGDYCMIFTFNTV